MLCFITFINMFLDFYHMCYNESIEFYYIYFLFFKFCSLSNLMPNFIPKILTVDFLSNFKLAEFEHEHEPGD
jgi:type IV secretory pathway VirB6-like protein